MSSGPVAPLVEITGTELDASYLGSTDRLRSDSMLPTEMPQATIGDYSGSGYDRGHMCPSGDRTLNVAANSETFYLTNMIPQAATSTADRGRISRRTRASSQARATI